MNAVRGPVSLAILLLVSVAAAPMRLPDVVYDRSPDAPGPVRFAHKSHSERVRNKCAVCHPQTFRIVHPTRFTSHAAMEAGGSCGACHDGKRAFDVRDAEHCETCHDTGGALAGDATLLTRSPYGRGRVCLIQPKDLAGELAGLKIGRPVADWYKVEIERLRGTKGGGATPPPAEDWAAFEQDFLLPVAATR